MARAKSKLAQGYFKTPVTEAGRIGNVVALYPYKYEVSHYDRHRGVAAYETSRGVHRVLDPCAGTGEAAALVAHRGAMTGLKELDSMADPAKVRTYGVEVNKPRAAQARRSLNHVIEGDLAMAEISKDMASVLYLNPPYDDDAEFRRLEHSFLVRTTPYLKVDGLLALIIPRRRLEVSADYLARNYEDFKFWTFGEKEYPVFKQIVLLAKKRYYSLSYESEVEEVRDEIVGWATGTDLVEPPEDRVVVMASEEHGAGKASVTFAKRRFNVEAALREVNANGITASESYVDTVWPEDGAAAVHPLMAPRKSHLTLLLMGGAVGRDPIAVGDTHVLVKGASKKVVDEDIEQMDEAGGREKYTYTERSVGTFAALDMKTWEFTQYE